jgi:hypothetical protein
MWSRMWQVVSYLFVFIAIVLFSFYANRRFSCRGGARGCVVYAYVEHSLTLFSVQDVQ